jgi:two-component system sensor histidine kinase DevS
MSIEQVGRSVGQDPMDDAVAWAIVALAPNGILLVDQEGHIVLANRQAEEMFGYEPGELLTAEVNQLVPAQIRNLHRAHREAYHRDPKTRPMGSGLDLHATRRDGTTFPVEIALSPLDIDGQMHVVAVVRDITDRLEAERQLQVAEQELSVLEDRERIARDLHDIVIQRLFAAGMSLQAVAGQSGPEVESRVAGVIDELDETIREIRQTIFRLTAHTLEPASLRRQIVDVVDREEEVLGFAPDVRFNGPVESLDDERSEHLLAVLREALSNVARHARASRVEVKVDVGAELTLTVTDDGVGVPPEAVAGGGTVNLHQRAEALGGVVEVQPAEPRGTSVRWSVPKSA